MARDRAVNPAQAQHKKDKTKQIEKAKAQKQAQLQEKLLKRNPLRVEREITQLEALEKQKKLPADGRKTLEELRKQLRMIRKAHERAGKPMPVRKANDGTFGSSFMEEEDRHVNGDGTFVFKGRERRSIYYDQLFNPTGLPPDGYPHQEWSDGEHEKEAIDDDYVSDGEDAADVPLPPGTARRYVPKAVETKSTYEAAPAVRDLTKESTIGLVPAAVRARMQREAELGPRPVAAAAPAEPAVVAPVATVAAMEHELAEEEEAYARAQKRKAEEQLQRERPLPQGSDDDDDDDDDFGFGMGSVNIAPE
ncbi:uncharacterized protein V1510DRAFT_364264 [Dipodascopsis tothii]|uniref:uncharacterized protein n=1 Tax=Dipodascopsis tothii TaxID=44089 RepID=UPI0034CDE4AD